ncbi:Fanconi-associated nuclease 1 homolog [Linum perenne]
MLTGQESLIRLVGKRRRFLPNRHSLLSTPLQGPYLGDNGEMSPVDRMEDLKAREDDQSPIAEWVSCPVCGSKVRGEDYMINSHLDVCLSKGKKRKLTQRTLLQLDFGWKASSSIDSSESEKLGSCVVSSGSLNNKLSEKAVVGLQNSMTAVEKDIDRGKSVLVVETSVDEQIYDNDERSHLVDSSSVTIANEVDSSAEDVTRDFTSGVTLDTYIVGRKFSVEKDLSHGAKISLLRDPENVKDPNAIKVLLGDSLSFRVLGFLPKELARCLSPLIEKHNLIFEGFITAVPENPLDAVPLQIMCNDVPTGSTTDCLKDFTSSWNNVIQVVESMKSSSLSVAKYQQNFGLLVEEVLRSNLHLFTDEEKKFLDLFLSISDGSQRLFLRLYLRKGPWFRMSSISYPEILNLEDASSELCANGYMHSIEHINDLKDSSMEEIFSLLTVSELREISGMLKKKGSLSTRKQDLVAELVSLGRDGKCPSLPRLILDKTGTCIKITAKAESLIWRAERLFFLNGEQDLRAFLLVDLGVVKYPSYKCTISEQIFSGRCELLAYEEAIEVGQIMDESLDESDSEMVLRCVTIAQSRLYSSCTNDRAIPSETRAISFSCFSASWVYSKVATLGISFLESKRRYNEAITLLKMLLSLFTCDGRRGYWTLRLSIDLDHVGCPNESLTIAENGLLDPWVRAGSKMALQRRIIRLAKPPRRWKPPSFVDPLKRKIKEVQIQGRPLNCETGTKSRYYGEDGDQCGVEQLALQYYAGEGGGWQGVHTETGIWLTIFGLLMWDVIFCDVPNVFYNKFQTAPLDFGNDGFYAARKSVIESQLQKIHDGIAEEILITSWELHLGTACRGVNWERHSLSELRAVVTCTGGPCLASLCRILAEDYRSWSSGMPDLLLWRFHEEGYRGEVKLVEVKGPRDSLSEQQRAWLLLLMDWGFNAEVCKVSPMPLST